MSSKPLVTVGVPVFNEQERLKDCIEALERQTYPNMQICISDNASTDGTYTLAQELTQKYRNISFVRQEESIGVLPNFDAVRRMAAGKYFMWVGADDKADPTYVEKMVDQLERHPKCVAAHSAIVRVDDDGNVLQNVRLDGHFNPNNVGPLRQAMLALSPFKTVRALKLNLYIYGLYRKSFLDQIMDQRENVLNKGDRVLPALAALSGGLRYVDEFLFFKHVHARSYRNRTPDDPLVKERLRYRELTQLISWIFWCPTVPLWRRWYGVVIALPYLLAKADEILKQFGLPPLAGTKFKF